MALLLDLALQRVYAAAAGRDAKAKVDSFCKPGGVYPAYWAEVQKELLSDLQKDECDAGVIASKKEVDAAWQKLVDMKTRQLKDARDEDIRSTNEWRGLYETAFATVKSFQAKEERWNAWIQYRLDTLEKFEVYADRQIAELNEAREKRCVQGITDVVLKDYKKYLVKTRKKKRKWGGVRRGTKFLALEFATKDVAGAKSLEDTGMRCATMLAMAKHAGHYDEKLTKGQKFPAAPRKSGPLASDQS
jgi:hypothetical protein